MRRAFLVSLAVAVATPSVSAQFGGTGVDGVFSPASDLTLNTDTRPNGWDYSVIDIPNGVTVTLVGSNPAILRSQTTIQIDGALRADGQLGDTTTGGAGGPGGFDGGFAGAPGFGPNPGQGGSFTTGGVVRPGAGGHQFTGLFSLGSPYGSARPFDMRGGSGGGGSFTVFAGTSGLSGGAGGGGVVVLLADGDVTIDGELTADGPGTQLLIFCDGCGAGGSVLVRSGGALTVGGRVSAASLGTGLPNSGDGYVRLDAYGSPVTIRPGGVVLPTPLELTLPDLEASTPVVGSPWTLSAASLPNDLVAFLFSTGTASIPIPGLGVLGLDPNAGIVTLGQSPVGNTGVDPEAQFVVPIPAIPSLSGVSTSVQALTISTSSPSGPRFSQVVTSTIL
ncbi:MAG: hypothetical protein AAF196_15535 [Planctomycetota bacterium]